MARAMPAPAPVARLQQEVAALRRRLEDLQRQAPSVVLAGFHPLKHAMRMGAGIAGAVTPDREALLALARALAPDVLSRIEAEVKAVPPEVFKGALLLPGEVEVVAVARRPAVDVALLLTAPGPAPVVLLDRPAHLGNIGAVIRVAAAAGAAGVLTTGTQDPWHPAALRGAAGLHFALPVARIEALPACDRPLVAIDPEGAPLRAAALPPRAILAFGSERRGLGADLETRANLRLAIPMRPGVSSLNLATAVAVTLYAGRT
jgi:RNA methyltransferase, TrmH family